MLITLSVRLALYVLLQSRLLLSMLGMPLPNVFGYVLYISVAGLHVTGDVQNCNILYMIQLIISSECRNFVHT